MLSKNKIKLITSLSQKKFRDETGLFVAEGVKLVSDLSVAFQCDLLLLTENRENNFSTLKAVEKIRVTEQELSKVSGQKSPQGVLAVFRKPEYQIDMNRIKQTLCLALDDVQDPGNLGTIIRVADWFGIYDIFCSLHSADAFSTKTVQATMGALARVRVHSVDLKAFLHKAASQMPVYGTFMDGENIYSKNLNTRGIIVMGNEGSGISVEIEEFVSEKLLIPNFPVGQVTSESLNVGVATALVCAEFRRRECSTK